METTLSGHEIESIVAAAHHDPFRVLGPHAVDVAGAPAVAVRAFLPLAREAAVLAGAAAYPMARVHPDGLFEAVIADCDPAFAYRLRAVSYDGQEQTLDDPYAFPPILSDLDLYLLSEGTDYQSYEKLGAHLRVVNGIAGAHFAVWAPNAQRVSLIGDLNQWDGRRHPMRVRGESGIWELFIPGLEQGTLYKYEIKGRDGTVFDKADPHAYAAEFRPRTASVVYDIDRYRWGDRAWMEARAGYDPLTAPVSIYEVHLGSWMRVSEEGNRFLTYRELAHQLVAYVLRAGYTHVELMPLAEHPLDASWGYQVVGYFAPTSRFGTPDDLMYMIDVLHQHGVGVILDWVPAHFPRDPHGLVRFDGTALYEYEDPRKGEHRDWGTLIFNYGRNEVENFLLSSGLFWLSRYHIDGLRVDAVASMLYLDYSRQPGEWEPNEYGGRENLEAIAFMRRFNELCYRYHRGIMTIAEESTSFPGVSRPTYLGGLGFHLKWNMGWMHDTLLYMSKDPLYRKYNQDNLTFGLVYAFAENFVLVLSHDEVVHGKSSMLGKMPGDPWQKFANLRLYYGFLFTHPGKKMLFMGSDFGQWNEWNEAVSLDWHLLQWAPHRQLWHWVRDLNHFYQAQPALYERDSSPQGFEWIDIQDWENSILSYIRRAADPADYLVVVCNFTPVPRLGYRIGVPEQCFYQEVLNSDGATYGGGNMGNMGGCRSDPLPWHGHPCSLCLTLPPLAAIVLRPARDDE